MFPLLRPHVPSSQIGLLTYNHRAAPLFPLNSDPGVLLQKIRNIPYTDSSGNNVGELQRWTRTFGVSRNFGTWQP